MVTTVAEMIELNHFGDDESIVPVTDAEFFEDLREAEETEETFDDVFNAMFPSMREA